MPNPERDEAIVSAYSILSLLHHRGLIDSPMNRADVESAMNKLRPFSEKAERRMMR